MKQKGDLPAFRRLDQLMVAQAVVPTRARAADAIIRGTVLVNGQRVKKPSQKVHPDAIISMHDPAAGYVSRAALKLLFALDHFRLKPAGRVCLDIGASTGGFTQVLLKEGARHVFAIDVGSNQLHQDLKNEPAITSIERLNCRNLTRFHLTGDAKKEPNIMAITCDVSFISLRLALPSVMSMAQNGCWAILLVKPQFEVGKDGVGSGGIVRDREQTIRAADSVRAWVNAQTGWHVLDLVPSPLLGRNGNQEYLLGAFFES